MAELIKAQLIELTDKKPYNPVDTLPVQFNPSSLHLVTSNRVTGGENAGQAVRQSLGTSGRTFTVTLEFDTADEGEVKGESKESAPVSVTQRIRWIERFLLPRKKGDSKPARLRFHWGEFLIDGIAESLDVTYTHFAANGTPLRASAVLNMREQDERYALKPDVRAEAAERPLGIAWRGARQSGGSSQPGENAQPGRGPQPGRGSRVAVALEGETAAELAARVGLDPRAWRGLGADMSTGLALPAGTEVAFQLGLDAGLGLGVRAGAAAGVASSASASLNARASAAATAGIAATAGASARASNSTGAGASAGASVSVRAGATAGASASRQVIAAYARAASFGKGIPLRARTDTAAPPSLRSTRGGKR